MNRNHEILAEIRRQPWAIVPTIMDGMLQALAAGEYQPAARDRSANVDGAVAVLPIYGTITQRGGWWSESADAIGQALDALIAAKNVGSIVLDIDSPGGSVYGVKELADKVHAARGKKPIVAVANSLAASAAYWIASQADELVVTPGGEVGSIGVFMVHADDSQFWEDMGVKITKIQSGKYKAEGYCEPLSDEAQAAMQADCDAYYAMFTRAVARGRGVGVEQVRQGFGEGRCVMANAALAENMVDRVATLDAVLGGLTSGQTKRGRSLAEAAAVVRMAEIEKTG